MFFSQRDAGPNYHSEFSYEKTKRDADCGCNRSGEAFAGLSDSAAFEVRTKNRLHFTRVRFPSEWLRHRQAVRAKLMECHGLFKPGQYLYAGVWHQRAITNTQMNLSATQFDLDNARGCAAVSAAAYRQETFSNPATDTHCLVVENSDSVIISFRGTASIRNWITDAEFKRNVLELEKDAQVHDGFLRAFDSILQPLSDYLKKIVVAKRKVFVTGHSLGGALAILAALELKRQGFNVAQVYTFGQPRVGNAAFKSLYEDALGASTFRVVYQEDIVARIPHLPYFHDPYRHVGQEVFISSIDSGELWFDPPLWRLLISDAWGIYRAFIISKFRGALDPVIDHNINNYIAALSIIHT